MSMGRRAGRFTFSILFASALVSGAALAATESSGLVKRVYHVEHLDGMDAIMLAHQLCLSQAAESSCSYSQQGRDWFTYETTPAVQERIAAMLKERDVATPTLSFRIVLLLADGTARPDPALSPGEQSALLDLKKLFPYKGYRIVDTGAIRSSAEAQLNMGGEGGYVAQMKVARNEGGRGPQLDIERFRLVRLPSAASAAAGKADDGERRATELIQTSFSMDVGETVVVGTSRLDGNDQALIVLLTAGR